MSKGTIIKVSEVAPFTLPGEEGKYSSRMLIDRTNSDSERLQINHFTLHPGCSTSGGIHKVPYDEVYYVLSGKAVLHMDGKDYDIESDDIVFIPGGTFHSLDNKSNNEDFVILAVWPLHPEKGVNEIYDMRIATWGKSYKTI
ncbi:MAG: cupin domain-containing protein [Clostridiales bacterium]|nr:cupin domain-containing protein [Clostridiales bacterium]